jgi:hypothetical protein
MKNKKTARMMALTMALLMMISSVTYLLSLGLR